MGRDAAEERAGLGALEAAGQQRGRRRRRKPEPHEA